MTDRQKRRQSALAQMLAQYGNQRGGDQTLSERDVKIRPQLRNGGAQPGDTLRLEQFFRPFAEKRSGGSDLNMPNMYYRPYADPDRKRGA